MQKYTIANVQARLLSLQDLKYQKYISKLLPGIQNVIGIRMSKLYELAAEMLTGDWRSYLDAALPQASPYYEEALLQGILIGRCHITWQERHQYIRAFVPKITNWGMCDIFCSTLKDARKHQQEYWQLILPYLASPKAYDVRFGAAMLLSYYINDAYGEEALKILSNLRHEDYYASNGIAWAISIFYLKRPQLTMPFLLQNNLDKFTHNRCIDKICESTRTSDEDRLMLKKLKR